jgi:hypothetical protein
MRMWTELVDSAGKMGRARRVLGCALATLCCALPRFCCALPRFCCALPRFCCALATFIGVAGCGNAIYAFQANSATSKLEAARELGAEQYAAYDYYMAVEHLQKAQEEAADADYSDAIRFAEICEAHAEKATTLSRHARRRAGN